MHAIDRTISRIMCLKWAIACLKPVIACLKWAIMCLKRAMACLKMKNQKNDYFTDCKVPQISRAHVREQFWNDCRALLKALDNR